MLSANDGLLASFDEKKFMDLSNEKGFESNGLNMGLLASDEKKIMEGLSNENGLLASLEDDEKKFMEGLLNCIL